MILVDAGDGASLRMQAAKLPMVKLDAVFLTHLHSDHIAGLGQVADTAWLLGRKASLPVYGPAGVDRLIAGFSAVYAADRSFRSKHQSTLAVGDGRPAANVITIPALPPHGPPDFGVLPKPDAIPVYTNGALRVLAFRVEHPPVEPAFGYRIEWRGRIIVVSGDTGPTMQVARNARDADVLIYEAIDPELVLAAADAAEKRGAASEAARFRTVLSYHSDIAFDAKVASAVRASALLLTHIIPPLADGAAETRFAEKAKAIFGGSVVVARDGTSLTLTAKTD
jgi:ribonuclease Z